ncbi:MarR family winged helix-turn-helix transcriptional regulator [Streptomyces yokosukanensis]|uniref:MarR family winged helix-turn-helix transcriptional regulator n=1 Tax=Streptomyces yokosukanensis TaxID=67386 RepID=UPI00343C4BBB
MRTHRRTRTGNCLGASDDRPVPATGTGELTVGLTAPQVGDTSQQWYDLSGTLADFADCSLSRLSHAVKRLEKEGWLYRTADPADGRFTLAFLTAAGWDKVVDTAPGHGAEVRRLVPDPLTKAQQKQLREIGRRINNAVGPDTH